MLLSVRLALVALCTRNRSARQGCIRPSAGTGVLITARLLPALNLGVQLNQHRWYNWLPLPRTSTWYVSHRDCSRPCTQRQTARRIASEPGWTSPAASPQKDENVRFNHSTTPLAPPVAHPRYHCGALVYRRRRR